MKYFAVIIIFISGAAFGYFYKFYETNKKIEALAIENIMYEIGTAAHLPENPDSTFLMLRAMNAASNLDVAIDKNESNEDAGFIESKTRIFNALYLQWNKHPPSHINELTDPEMKKWAIERHQKQMAFLKTFHESCLKNKELKCKDS